MKSAAIVNPSPLEYVPSVPDLAPSIMFGTCGWAHPFWKGQIYHRHYESEKEFNLRSLQEYASLGLFRMVEIDSTFYAPPSVETLEHYASLVPEHFRFVAKIWERFSIPVFPQMKRHGSSAGMENPDFLNVETFKREFLTPFSNPSFSKKLASFLLQFPHIDMRGSSSRSFFSRLDEFLGGFPEEFRLTIEIRNSELLTPEYISLLNRYKISHCFNQWQSMPRLIEQMKMVASAGGLASDLYVARLLTPYRVGYEDAKKLFEPFHEIKRRDGRAREDITRLARRAIRRNGTAFVIVNNRFEGNSPCTVWELEQSLIASLNEKQA